MSSARKSTIGEKIKQARTRARDGEGISQSELAELVGIKQASLSQIESGVSTPRKQTQIALARVLENDFGEPWLQDYLTKTKNTHKTLHPELDELLSEANELSEKSIRAMQPIWEMFRAEIKRRKRIEKNQNSSK